MRPWTTACIALCLSCSRGATPDIPPIALTPVEYNNTVRDLLGMPDDGEDWPPAPAVAERLSPPRGVQSGLFEGAPNIPPPWPWVLPEEAGVDDFEGMAEGQAPSAYQLEELQKAAVHFGAYTLVSPSFHTCADWSQLPTSTQESCAWSDLERFASRAWRRPLTESETQRLTDFWNQNLSNGDLDEAIALTAAGVLQAPQFLYRIERGEDTKREKGRVRLTEWEVASRLSYLLWDSMPDQALFVATLDGELSKTKGIREQTRRMLEDPRAEAAIVHFHTQWLGTDRVHGIAPARHIFGPRYDLSPYPALGTTGDEDWPRVLGPARASMDAETQLFVSQTLFHGVGTLEALLSDHHGYLSESTAPVYGPDVTPLSGESFTWDFSYIAASGPTDDTLTLTPTTFPPSQRAGLLTMPSVLSIGAHPVHPSPILRGVRILERVTCADLGVPPPGAEGTAPPDIEEALATNRERTENVTSPPSCAVCHDTINPAGFAFEHYDAMGAWRDTDNGQPIDASGALRLGEDTLRFNDGVDLAKQLATHDQVRDCYATRWTDYALGTTVDPTDPDVAQILKDFRKNDNVLDLIEAITTSELFRYRTLGGTP